MNRSPAEMESLDEKIARIRKKNEAIIKRKQIIEEEIKQAKLMNAIVNTSKSYDDTEDVPTLYSDAVEENRTRKLTNISMPRATQEKCKTVGRNENNDEAWRKERKQIDSERIRRQKADSGWRREWDANKVVEDDGDVDWRSKRDKGDSDWRSNRDTTTKFIGDENTNWRCNRNAGSKPNSRKFDDEKFEDTDSRFAGRLETRNESRDADKPAHQQSARRIPRCDGQPARNSYVSNSWRNADGLLKRDDKPLRNDLSNRSKAVNKTDGRLGERKRNVNVDHSNNNARKSESTAGPLLKDKNLVTENVMVVAGCKVTRFADVAQPPSLANQGLRKRGEKFPLKEQNLNERLKNIVIRVKTEENKPAERVVELVDAQSEVSGTDDGNIESSKGANSSQINLVVFERTIANNVLSENASVPHTVYIQNAKSCSSVPDSTSDGIGLPPAAASRITDASVKSKSIPVGILKKSLSASISDDPLSILPTRTTTPFDEKSKGSTGVVENMVGDDDDEWEDASDEDWEDVSEEE